MDKKELFDLVVSLRKDGHNFCEISRRTGVNRRTVMDWCSGKTDKTKLKKTNYKICDDDFIKHVNESLSLAEVLRKCELNPYGSNYSTIKTRISRLGLSTSHFSGQGHLKGKSHDWSTKLSDGEIFIKGDIARTGVVKRALLRNKIFDYECSVCKISKWNGIVLSLHLDHIDGDNTNNLISNLRFLCPNCHSQTSTYCGKNISK